MKILKRLFIVFTLSLIYLTLSSSSAFASNITIANQFSSANPNLYITSDYSSNADCIQMALDNSKNGDNITFLEGDYYITKQIYQKDKSLNIAGNGNVTLHLQVPEAYGKEASGIFFTGTMITSQTLSRDAKKNSSTVILIDSANVKRNDLIKIWKDIQWCPLNFSDQMTGEMYVVRNVDGNVITLNQPLLRDYNLSDTVHVETYRPIEMHINNLRIEDSGATKSNLGLTLNYCKDSSVTNCWFKNSGLVALSFYSCFNVDANNNQIYNSLLPGSGYGIGVWSGSAFVRIDNNHIENCRHTITGNTAERISLNRDVFITNNTLIGGNIVGSNVIDSHPVTINYVVIGNKIYPKLPYFLAFDDGTQQSIFSGNKVYGGYGGITRRANVKDGVHIIKDNIMDGISGFTYENGDSTIQDTLIIQNNTQNGGEYGVCYPPGYDSFEQIRNIIIVGNKFSNISNQAVCQKFLINGVNLNISDNTFKNIGEEGIYIDGSSFKNGKVVIHNNTLINVLQSNPSAGVTIKNIQNAIVSDNIVFQAPPAAAFSTYTTLGKVPLSVALRIKV
jgi:hypothetical protein